MKLTRSTRIILDPSAHEFPSESVTDVLPHCVVVVDLLGALEQRKCREKFVVGEQLAGLAEEIAIRQKVFAIFSLDGARHLVKRYLRLAKPDTEALLLFQGHVQRRNSRNAIGDLGRMLIIFGVLAPQVAKKRSHAFRVHVGHVHAPLATFFRDRIHHLFGNLGAFLGLQL